MKLTKLIWNLIKIRFKYGNLNVRISVHFQTKPYTSDHYSEQGRNTRLEGSVANFKISRNALILSND